MSGNPQLELIRAYQNFFRLKGEGARVGAEIIPVVIMDDNSKGPYQPAVMWQSGFNGPAVGAGNYNWGGVKNDEPPERKSVVVVDEIRVKNVGAADCYWWVGLCRVTDLAFGGAAPRAVSEENDPQPYLDPPVGGILVSVGSKATAIVAGIYPGETGADRNKVVSIPGPWMLGPQSIFAVQQSVDNLGMMFWARGRKYSSL